MKVFLVEDSKAVRERLRGMLANIPDIELVAEADNEEEAIQGIYSFLPDVVILDLTLAAGSGMGVLRRIRLQPLILRVIVLTNFTSPKYREKCVELGADYFLDKTHEISEFEALLIQMSGSLKTKLMPPSSLLTHGYQDG